MQRRYLVWIVAVGLAASAAMLPSGWRTAPPVESGRCVTAPDGRPMGSAYLDMDVPLGAIAREFPSFAGLWRESQLVVAMTDTRTLDRVRLADAIARQYGPSVLESAGFRVVEAEYSFVQLAAWYDCMRDPVWATGGVITTDVDERANRIRIEAKSAEARRGMEEAIATLGIPARAVIIEVRQPIQGPAPGPDEQVLAHRLLASAKKLPPREVGRGEDIAMKLAEDQQRYGELWRLFGLEGDTPGPLPAVDWATEAVLFAGLVESGTCPLSLTAVSLEPSGKLAVYTSIGDERYVCTSDARPRTFVVALPRAALPIGLIRATVRSRHLEPELLLREDDPSIPGRLEWSWEGKGAPGAGSLIRRLHVVALPDRVMVTVQTDGQPIHLQNTTVQYGSDGVEARLVAHLGGAPAVAASLDHPLLRGVRMEEQPGGYVILKLETNSPVFQGRWYEGRSLIGAVLLKKN